MSLRVKVTAWIVLIFLVIQVSLVFVFQLYQGQTINAYFTRRLLSRTQAVAERLGQQAPRVSDDDLKASNELTDPVTQYEQFAVTLYDGAGNVIAASRRPPAGPPPRALWEQVHAGADAGMGTAPAESLERPKESPKGARAVLVKARSAAGEAYYFYAVSSDANAQDMLGLMGRVLIVSIPIGVIAVAVSAYLIAGIATGPLHAIREVARRLSPESIGERLLVPAGSSEVAGLRQDLENARQRLEAGFNAQERFMSNVSHELKTPIAVILTEAQTLRLDGAPAPVKEFVRGAVDELDKLARTVDSFLLLTRVRHGKASTPSDRCLFRDILLDSYAGCVTMAYQHGVRLDVTLPEDEGADATVTGNCDLLRTICDNLMRNAIRHSPKEAAVRVLASLEGPWVRLSVLDDGPGIPEDLLPRIFDRFSRSKDSDRRGRGHGLGLEIAQGIAELHGGRITAANRPEGGCEFTVRLPLADTPAAPGAGRPPAAASNGTGHAPPPTTPATTA
jgi:signal transduction histidine kinase